MIEVWIDIETGTYGDLSTLRIKSLTPEQVEALDLGQLSDSEIAELGESGASVVEWL